MGKKPAKNKPGIHLPLLAASITLTIILIIMAIFSIKKEYDITQLKNDPNIRSCPDGWYINRMPDTYAETDDMPNEYMVYGKQRIELVQVDVDWVKANCQLKEPQPVY
jgi:hypothetical protein